MCALNNCITIPQCITDCQIDWTCTQIAIDLGILDIFNEINTINVQGFPTGDNFYVSVTSGSLLGGCESEGASCSTDSCDVCRSSVF